ncbi:MAG: TolC family protein, partial [Bacteroidota bacterium]
MKRKILLSLTLVTHLFVASPADARVQDQPMSLWACVLEARKNNHGLRASHAKVVAAEAKAREAFSAILPQVRLSSRFAQLSDIDPFSFTAPGFGSFTLFPNIDHSYSARVSLLQPVFTGFRLLKNIEAARLNASATEEDFAGDERELILEVKTTYWNLVRARQAEEFLKQTVEQVSEHLKDAENFYKQGLATQNDVYKVEVQLADVKVKQIEAETNRRLMTMALNNLMGKPLESSIIPTEDPEMPAKPGEPIDTSSMSFAPAFLQWAQENRPELKAIRLRKEMSEAAVGAARAGWLPQIALSANYEYARPNQRIIPPKDEWRGTWDVGLIMQWSVWDWFT